MLINQAWKQRQLRGVGRGRARGPPSPSPARSKGCGSLLGPRWGAVPAAAKAGNPQPRGEGGTREGWPSPALPARGALSAEQGAARPEVNRSNHLPAITKAGRCQAPESNPPFPGTNPAPGQPRPPPSALFALPAPAGSQAALCPGLGSAGGILPETEGRERGGGELSACNRCPSAHLRPSRWYLGSRHAPNAAMGGRPGCAAIPSKALSLLPGHQAATSCCPLEVTPSPRRPLPSHHGGSP